MPYNQLIIDSYNVAHRLFYSSENHDLVSVSNKLVYLFFVKKYIEYIDFLREKFGEFGCMTYLLFDNPTSRSTLKHDSIEYNSHRIRYELDPEYKANRRKESKEFYNSIQFIKFLFSVKGPLFATIRIPNLEADDLVKPVISDKCGEGKTLMVSTDMDWCRFLSPFVHILSGGIHEPVVDIAEFNKKYGFPPAEEKIVLYKIMFGDESDNIRPIFSEIPKQIRHNIVEKYQSVNDIYIKLLPEFVEYQAIFNTHKKDVKVAHQLLSVIPVEISRINAYTIKGRVVPKLQEIINRVFEEFEKKKTPKKFSFGKIKTPRL